MQTPRRLGMRLAARAAAKGVGRVIRMGDADFMARAIEISRQSLAKPGTMPFGAVVVKDGAIIGEGLNHSGLNHDPTSHGEVEAIRDACRKQGTTDLSGSVLYTSCEPCSLCVAAMYLAGIERFVYAASLEDYHTAYTEHAGSGAAPIDTDRLRVEVGKKVHDRSMPVRQLQAEAATAVLAAWIGRG
jgi:tRNA(Arg) A34 adenosine deaminase TadA